MSKIKNLMAGLAGAIALNVLHESLKKKSPDMPRVDLLGAIVTGLALTLMKRS